MGTTQFVAKPEAIRDELRGLFGRSASVDLAVAYVSAIPPSMADYPNPLRLVCCFRNPTTNPYAVEAIAGRVGAQVRKYDLLHAKVYVGHDPAVAMVGSANLSRPALGLGPVKPQLESALVTRGRAVLSVAEWYDDLWTEASVITKSDFQKRKLEWDRTHGSRRVLIREDQNPGRLVMELNREQGAGRETQVQPPMGVWREFFQIDVNDGRAVGEIEVTLVDELSQEARTARVVAHDHNFTIEIPAVGAARPAILVMQRLGAHSYVYSVLRPPAKQYYYFDRRLTKEHRLNQKWTRGRKWILG